MSIHSHSQGTCRHCGGRQEIDIYSSVNVTLDPDLKGRVKDGSLFVWECRNCGEQNLARYECLYHDSEQRLMVWLLPDGAVSSDEMSFLTKKVDGLFGSLGDDDKVGISSYTLRRVNDVGSLIEKVNIFDAGLDDVVIEMCKYVTKMELAEQLPADKAAAVADAPFKFFKIEGADNELTFSFPLDGNMQGINVGFNVYEDCRGILQRNPSVSVPEGFAKIDYDWLSKYFR